jgi:adiponectin receptor
MDPTARRRKGRSSERTSDLKASWNRRHIINSSRRPLLCAYEELPTWYKESENEYIRHGYRPELQSTWACLSSWTYVHNESFNIYSHLVAAISFLVGLILMDRLIVWHFPAATIVDRAVFAFFVSAGIGAFTLSFLYHTFICHSLHFSNLWLQLDFVGIVVLTLGGFVSGIYVGFYCDPALQKVHWSMVSTAACPLDPDGELLNPPSPPPPRTRLALVYTLTSRQILSLSILSSLLVLHPRLQGRKWRNFRVTVFVSTGLSGFAPVIHGVLVYGFDRAWQQTGMPYYLLEGAIFILGVMFYAFRFPESSIPGKFDMWGSSHNIFHVLVVIATLVHLVGIWQAFGYQYRHNGMCAAP